MHRLAVELPQILQRGQVVDQPGGDQQDARVKLLARFQGRSKTARAACDTRDFDFPQLDRLAIPLELRARNFEKLRRRRPVARKKAVEDPGGLIARISGVAHEDPPQTATQHQSRA